MLLRFPKTLDKPDSHDFLTCGLSTGSGFQPHLTFHVASAPFLS